MLRRQASYTWLVLLRGLGAIGGDTRLFQPLPWKLLLHLHLVKSSWTHRSQLTHHLLALQSEDHVSHPTVCMTRTSLVVFLWFPLTSLNSHPTTFIEVETVLCPVFEHITENPYLFYVRMNEISKVHGDGLLDGVSKSETSQRVMTISKSLSHKEKRTASQAENQHIQRQHCETVPLGLPTVLHWVP